MVEAQPTVDYQTGWTHDMVKQFYRSMEIVHKRTRFGWSLHADKGYPLVAKLTVGHRRALRMGRGLNEVLIDMCDLTTEQARLLERAQVIPFPDAKELQQPHLVQVPNIIISAFIDAFQANHEECVKRLADGEAAQSMEKGIYTRELANHLYRISRRSALSPGYVRH